MKLVLGVHDIPYAAQFRAGSARRGKSKAQQGYGRNRTTGDVAEILEAKYHVMKTFTEMAGSGIARAIEKSVTGSIINVVNGQPGPIVIEAQALSDIETAFKRSLSAKAYDGIIQGVPTQASLGGVSHRFKRPYARRPSRPSFINTGLYQSSFAAWTE